MSIFHLANLASDKHDASKQGLSGDSSVGEWLSHPVGGAIMRDMLKKAGQDEKVLHAVRRLSMKRLVSLSRGQFTQEMLNDMIRRVNAGQVPTRPIETSASTDMTSVPVQQALPPWEEKITPGRFNDKTVIVTGAGSGIGKATASRVSREGGRVIAVDISQERLDTLKSELVGGNITIVQGDITNDACISQIMVSAGNRIDALANIAGIMDNFTPLHEMSDEVWNRVMNVNLLGMMKLSRAVIPKMLARRTGSIVNVGSEATLKASAAGAAYTTSKHAVAGLSKSMAFMYGPIGLRINVLAPGGVITNIEAKFDSKLGSERVNSILATMPETVEAPVLAASITFLLSDDSVNINGVVLPSDGGWSVQ
jgi:NAD(P)-dependent dehydrogenase (short-subunit alcohol dehydrogenase family)